MVAMTSHTDCLLNTEANGTVDFVKSKITNSLTVGNITNDVDIVGVDGNNCGSKVLSKWSVYRVSTNQF